MVLYMHGKLTEIHRRSSRCTCNLPSTSVHFQCISRILHQLLCIRGTFHQLSVRPQIFLQLVSTSVNFQCGRGTLCQHSVRPQDLPSTFRASTGPSVNFPGSHGIFRKIVSTFLASKGPSVNFHQLSLQPANFCQLSVYLCDLPSTFCTAV